MLSAFAPLANQSVNMDSMSAVCAKHKGKSIQRVSETLFPGIQLNGETPLVIKEWHYKILMENIF